MKVKKLFVTILISSVAFTPFKARADLFGGDVAVLTQILAQSIKQLYELRQILKNGSDSLTLMREINQGIRNGLAVIQIINPKFNPGLYGNLDTAERVMAAITDLYGAIPRTSESRLQEAQDRSVAESIAMNGQLFRYADDVDAETRRIIEHAQVVSPQGAGKLTAQSMAILIGVTTQVLRTNSMMLKMMSENMALSNRKEKLQSEQFKSQYEGLSHALGAVPTVPTLKALRD